MIHFLQTFFVLLLELTALFLLISAVIGWLQRTVTEDRIQRILHRPNKWSGYLYGTGLGALTPFCSCSTIPIVAGLLSSKAPFGPSMSYLIASPLLNPVLLLLFWTLLGWKLTVYYILATVGFSILIGWGWEKLGLETAVKQVRVKKGNVSEEKGKPKWKLAIRDAWSFFLPLFPYLFIGVLIGAFIYDFVPQDTITTYAGGDNLWTVPAASIIGIPMYIRVETILPIAGSLVSKGMSEGAILALTVGGAGASIPEIVMLSKLFQRKLVLAFIASILLAAVSTGLLANIML
ncbi:permease [Salibacterium aidingense]|uniref:permease n=1 Tax=Salibacterium aidingense TaxID=384933 RepID=UPI0004032771|nr:permease [Salibacterium aidingense]